MEPFEFKGHNIIIAKDQPPYLPLPAFITPEGVLITCFKVSPEEAKKIAETGELYVQVMTFGNPLQPLFLTAYRGDVLQDNFPRETIEKMIEAENPTAKAKAGNEDFRVYQCVLNNGYLASFEVPRSVVEVGKVNIEQPAKDLLFWLKTDYSK